MGYGVIKSKAVGKTFWKNFKWKVIAIPIILGAITFTVLDKLEAPTHKEISLEGRLVVDGKSRQIENSKITISTQKESLAGRKILLSLFPLFTFFIDIFGIALNPKNYGSELYEIINEKFNDEIKSGNPRYKEILEDLRGLRAQLLSGQVDSDRIRNFIRELGNAIS